MTGHILQANPKASYMGHRAAIDAAVAQVLHSGWYILGTQVAAFEEEYAAYLGATHAVGVASGTDALVLALRACGVGPGDLVFTVSHTAVATVAAIDLCGALPVFVDIDPLTFTMDADDLECAIAAASGGVPKAVIPVHLYGQPADLQRICATATQHGLRVVEDCAQAHGAMLNAKKLGTWGDCAAFSFYPTKNLGALGDGGMVVTNDTDLATAVRQLRQYGWEQRYISATPGLNSRLDELQAAILRVKLPHLDSENAARRAVAAHYQQALSRTSLQLPHDQDDETHVFHQFVVQCEQRDSLQAFLQRHDIDTAVHYPLPVHMQPAYRQYASPDRPLPNTEHVASRILSLPMYPQLTREELSRITDVVLQWADEGCL